MNKTKRKPSGNIFLLLISIIVASFLIVLFFTQTEGIKGWEYQSSSPYSYKLKVALCDDLNEDIRQI